jgi:hypothetical protein
LLGVGQAARVLLGALLFLLVAVGESSAQAVESPGAAPEVSAGLSPQEVQRLFDAYTVVQAQDQLSLSDDQYGRFVTRLKALQDVRRQHLVRRERLVRELARMVQPRGATTDVEIKARLDELTQSEQGAASEERQAYDQIDELLDLRQRARFRVFEAAMERRKLDLLVRARQSRPLAPRRSLPPR